MSDTEIVNQVEAILFSTGKKVSLEEISKLARIRDLNLIKKALMNLKEKYEKTLGPLILVEERNTWKLTVRERYQRLVRKIVADTELTKSMTETLAVVAWKQPVLQSGVIKIRTNKAYKHLEELEKDGFITRTKHGRTKMIKLTDKFFKYFEVSDEDIKKIFKRTEQKDDEAKKELESEEASEGLKEETQYDSTREMPKMQAENEVPEQEQDSGK